MKSSYRTKVYLKDDRVCLDWKVDIYSIELTRLNTHEKLLKFVFHLTQKTIFEINTIRDFIMIVAKHNKLEIYGC